MGTQILLYLMLLSITKVFSSTISTTPEPPMGDIKDFDVYIKPKGYQASGVSPVPCNRWVYVYPGISMTIQSPNYPWEYGWWYTFCDWMFVASPSTAKLDITCQVFGLRNRYFDWLEVRPSYSTVNWKSFRGSKGPNHLISTYNWAYIFFIVYPAFYWEAYEGFSCTVTAVEPTTIAPATTTTTPTPCKCGRKGDPDRTRIVGGVNAGLHEFPWQCALVLKSDRSQVICGAVLINTEYVVTAAHCVPGGVESLFEVVCGEHDTSKTDETTETVYRDISSAVSHPDYNPGNQANPGNQENDLALVKLSSPVDFDASDAIKPICFPDPSDLYDNELVTVTGWGLLSTVGPQPDVLQTVNVTTMTNTACQDQYTPQSSTITANMICASDIERDTCQGDNGGPMIALEGDHYVLVGITSIGILCANPDTPGVYTRFGNYIDWVNGIVDPANTCMV